MMDKFNKYWSEYSTIFSIIPSLILPFVMKSLII